ncbi:protein of unknown function [Hyphomicrobium sp. 1Nfss2.1]|uniref:hypothetical protein n=1 Tax=Hyphomicrobium sp. 1Nfss2.1 TaxID=3413936 RepID=UPI003C7D5AF0
MREREPRRSWETRGGVDSLVWLVVRYAEAEAARKRETQVLTDDERAKLAAEILFDMERFGDMKVFDPDRGFLITNIMGRIANAERDHLQNNPEST